jgi:NitT/TauT family transport system substrate-binding protein
MRPPSTDQRPRMIGRRTLGAAASALALMAIAGPGRAADAPPDKLRLVFSSQVILANEQVATYAVAEKLGFFKAENLDVSWTTSDGSTAGILSVASNSADLTASSAVSAIPAVTRGVRIKVFAGLVVNWPYQMAVAPDSPIKTAKDLAGRKIGISSLASASYTFAQATVKLAGVDPKSVNYLPVGDGPTAAVAMRGGQIDVLALYSGSFQGLESAGLKLRYVPNLPYFDALFSLSWLGRAADIESNPGLYARFGRAVAKAMLFSAANPAAAVKIGQAIFPTQILPKNFDSDVETLKVWLKTATPTTGEPKDWGDYQWGALTDARWDTLEDFIVQGGISPQKPPLDQVRTTALIPEINKFDRAAVLKLAASQ